MCALVKLQEKSSQAREVFGPRLDRIAGFNYFLWKIFCMAIVLIDKKMPADKRGLGPRLCLIGILLEPAQRIPAGTKDIALRFNTVA